MILAPPVRKKMRGDHQPGDPLPVPIASLTGLPTSAASWNYYSGIYKDGVVVVTDLNYISSLWHNGYFGQLKNTHLQREAFNGEESYKYQKTWTLLESEGIKDATFFQKTMEVKDNDEEAPESSREEGSEYEFVGGDERPKSESREPEDSDCEIVGEDDSPKSESKQPEDSDCEVVSEDENPKSENRQSEDKDSDNIDVKNDGILDVKNDGILDVKNDGNLGQKVCAEVSDKEDENKSDLPQTKNIENAVHEQKEAMNADPYPNCKKVLTFESDQISSLFFDDFNADTSCGHMELLLEEAMFLSYALGCLVVKKQKPQTEEKRYLEVPVEEYDLPIDYMWKEFVSRDLKFAARYAVYHHYRTKGWVVKSGLKFGADFVLYPVGPPFYHAQYTVMIQSIWSDNNRKDESLSSREMSWINYAASARLNNHVKKTPIICYVLRPRSLTHNKLKNILCLKSLKIKEVLLSRWDPTDVSDPAQDLITLE